MNPPFLAHLPGNVAERLGRALAGIPTFLVGGTARDWVLHLRGKPLGRKAFRDLDLVCAAPDAEIEARFRAAGFRPVPVGRQFEVIKIVEPGIEIDASPLAKGLDRRPEPGEIDRRLDENLSGRDLTLNAMALAWPDGALRDPVNGQADIDARRIRAVGRAEDRLAEDPLRALRAARFAALLEFEVDPELLPAMRAIAPRTAEVAPERVRAELLEILAVPRPSVALRLLLETGVLAVLLPELAACASVAQNRLHRLDVLDHSLLACDLVPPARPLVRVAALLHDAGKPAARAFRAEKGDFVFHGHDEAGAALAEARLRALKFANDEIAAVAALVREHMFRFTSDLTPRAVRRWIARLGPVAPRDAIRLALADRQATDLAFGVDPATRRWLRLVRRIEVERPPLRVADLAVGGNDLIALGMTPGPACSKVLNALLDWVLEDPARNEREGLIAEARRMIGGA